MKGKTMEALKIAFRNLIRSKRRTFLTSSLIAVGVMFVLIFVAFAGSFKNYMISQITDSMLGNIQIHRKGYVSSLDNLPLDKNIPPKELKDIKKILESHKEIYSYSFRLKLGGMISNFKDSTNIRLNGINPEMESKTLPLLKNRLKGHLPKVGEIVIPELIAKGMKLKIGDSVVLVVTNRSGSMNAKTLKISGIVGILTGPGGRDGYINLKDARFLLRINKPEINEIVIKLKNPQKTLEVTKKLKKELKNLKPPLEVHPWQKLTPFINIANMIDVMTFSVEIVLISIVLISILNIMIMSVYERIKLIGTLKAIGTKKSFILSMFVSEGVLLGLFGFVLGIIGSLMFIFIVGDIHYSFGRIKDLILHPELDFKTVIMVSVLVLVVSVFASLYPASKAANLRPVEALRS